MKCRIITLAMCSLMLTYYPICIEKKLTIKPAELLNQYTESCRVAIKSSSAKLDKTFENLLLIT